MIKKSTVSNLSNRIKKNSESIKKLNGKTKKYKGRPSAKFSKYEVRVKKAIRKPNFKNKTVLTDSTWTYVKIYLKNKGEKEALFYWEQSENFFKATQNLSLVSSPLTTYYCFLNATKALLVEKKISFDSKHGVSGKKIDGRFNLQNEQVILKPKGILSSLCRYLEEPISNPEEKYTLKDIFYNLPYIHRAFNLTFKNYPELFVPIINPRFVIDKHRKVGWFEAHLEQKHSNQTTLTRLIGFSLDKKYDCSEIYTIRRNKTFTWDAPRNSPTQKSKASFGHYYKNIRKNLRYIYGTNDLWYIKRKDVRNNLINKSTLALSFAAMHRLSEMSRYNPKILNEHIERNASWLLTEFINKSLFQFIDQISSEITGDDFRVTGFRQ